MSNSKMTKKMLTALTAIIFVLLAASPYSAQERQIGNGGTVLGKAEVEKFRNDQISIYAETEALFEFLAGYDFIRQSEAMKNYDAIRQSLARKRQQIEQMSDYQLMSQGNTWHDKYALTRITKLSRSVRTDAKLQDTLQKVEKYIQTNPLRRTFPASAVGDRLGNLRGVIASTSYIEPDCDYNDPSNYPSGVDLGIASGVAIALHFAADLAPGELEEACTLIPNPVHIVFAIAAGVADEVLNALQAIATNSTYCEALRLNVEDKLKDDRGLTTALVNVNYYLKFMFKSCEAALATATSANIPVNCGQARFNEAKAFFDGSGNFTGGSGANRLEAYKKLRATYQNIGASECVQ
ncbi:MAG TPA: hypothetical protein PLK30_14470 [Blastocatellia bacterium]|nr:hypothetical protein [Blastocatellia bacterium]